MITSAQITATSALPNARQEPAQLRGALDYPINGWDLIDFGHSPDRWVNGPRPEPDTKPDFDELVQLMHLTPSRAPASYIQRPATYLAMYLVCPICGSSSTAKICRACNIARTNVTEQKPWSNAAKYCAAWTADAQSRNLRVVPADAWETAALAVARLNADPEIADLANQSAKQLCLSGAWHDEDTGLDIPLRGFLSYAPNEGQPHDNKLGSLVVTRDASPYAWASRAYKGGTHIVAALLQDLYAAATNDPRAMHVWVLLEREPPHVLGRRRTTAEMLAAGRSARDELMAAYAKSLKTGIWPAFDPLLPGADAAWSEFHLEPWMTQGDGQTGGYFAVAHAPDLPEE